ncbi:MAG: transporter substrate-binding domain-containing protein [Actinobacteria bacterium]|nr:transporter substrate-binding domain-containing protein [Actinomycetota bacterium]
MRNALRPILAAGLAASLLFGTAACGSDSDSAGSDGGSDTTDAPSTAIKTLDDLAGKTIGVQTGTTGETYANDNKPEGAEIKSFSDTDGLFGALESGDIDAILQDLPVNAGRVAEDDSVAVVETYKTDEQYGFAVEKGSDSLADWDKALQEVRDEGTYDLIYAKYFPTDGEEAGPGPEASDVEGSKTFRVCSDIPYAPMEFEGEGPRGLQYTGFDIDLLDAMAATLDANLEILDVEFDGILGNLAGGTCDIVASSLTITDERKQEVDFTEPYFDADQSLLVKVG